MLVKTEKMVEYPELERRGEITAADVASLMWQM